MKTFKIKNYKGNLVESLKRFQESHKDMKIVEASEVEGELKIKVQEAKSTEPKYEYVVYKKPRNGKWELATDMKKIETYLASDALRSAWMKFDPSTHTVPNLDKSFAMDFLQGHRNKCHSDSYGSVPYYLSVTKVLPGGTRAGTEDLEYFFEYTWYPDGAMKTPEEDAIRVREGIRPM